MDLDKLEELDTTELDNSPDLDDLVYEDPNRDNESEEDDTNASLDQDEEEDNDYEQSNGDNSDNNDVDNISDKLEIEETTDVDTEPNDNSKILIDFGDGQIEANNIDELKTIASKALKDKTRYDRNKEQLAVLEGVKEQGLSEQDLYLLVEAKKGNKQALAKLLKEANVDPYELDPEELDVDGYKPNEYKADPKIVEVKSIIDDVKQNETAFKTFNYMLNNEFNESDRAKAFEDPNLLSFLGETIKSGIFDKIAPNYTKRKIMGENPISAYIDAYDDYMKEINNTKQETVSKAKQENQEKVTKRKKASEGTKKSRSNKAKKSVEDMSDAEFEKYYKSIVGDF